MAQMILALGRQTRCQQAPRLASPNEGFGLHMLGAFRKVVVVSAQTWSCELNLQISWPSVPPVIQTFLRTTFLDCSVQRLAIQHIAGGFALIPQSEMLSLNRSRRRYLLSVSSWNQ